MELALEAGADDVKTSGDKFEITCEVSDYQTVSDALATAEIEPEVKELALIPKDTVDLDVTSAQKVLKLMEKLDDHDDVQSVSSNFNIPDEVMAQLDAG
jgi:transcriptional/translational regulatory protein YebC/TACO1